MEQTNLSRILKLGMAIRYLYREVKEDTPMYGERHVIPNIDQVLSTLADLGFTQNHRVATLHAKLKTLKESLNQSGRNAVSAEQAKEISTLFGEIRTAVYAYGDSVQVVESDLAISGDISFEKLFKLLRRLTIGQAIATGTTLVAVIGFIFALGQQWHLIPSCTDVTRAAAGTQCLATVSERGDFDRIDPKTVVEKPEPMSPVQAVTKDGAAEPEVVPAPAPGG